MFQDRPSVWSALAVAHLLVLACLIGLVLLYLSGSVETESLLQTACGIMLLLYGWIMWSWRAATRELFHPYILFVSAVMLFHGGHVVLEIFRLNEYGILEGRFTPDITLQSILLVTIGMAALHAGALLCMWRSCGRTSWRDGSSLAATSARQIRFTGYTMLLVSLLPSLVLIRRSLFIVMASGYFGLYQQKPEQLVDIVIEILAGLLIPGAVFLLVGSKENRSGIWVATIVIFLGCMAKLFTGQRAAGLLPMIVYAWLWHKCIRPMPKAILVAGIAFCLLIFPLLSLFRELSGAERISLPAVWEALQYVENPVTRLLTETGWTLSAVAYTLEQVPEQYAFDWGAGYLYALRFIIPNSFWNFQPEFPSYSHWFVWTYEPATASLGGGLGFSFLAEAYMNFGWAGVALIAALIGYSIPSVTAWAQRSPMSERYALVGCILTFALVYVRSESLYLIRPCAWYIFAPYYAIALCRFFFAPRRSVPVQSNMLVPIPGDERNV